ncbi:MAG: hypothetical protein E7626_07100 [Ruminococcaceae bacterium]|nr:hypothetical protein [Oscillospiraceae bacterium]
MIMLNINIDFNKTVGKIKPMHATNNGPAHKYFPEQRVSNMESFREAGIPYARLHDCIECITYGGAHCGDISAMFPDFDKDPYDPDSYDFRITDEYVKVIIESGAKPFFGLAPTIEHLPKKYEIFPPKDFHKWAVICEHIIRHYNEGWNDGYQFNIEYWEIWNQPDEIESRPQELKVQWLGTKQQFFDFYNEASTHLKGCFPNLKIGGPSIAWDMKWVRDFLAAVKIKPDFFSYHSYASTPEKIIERIKTIQNLLDEADCGETENILDEWNYVRSWFNEDWVYSLRKMKEMKGASFYASTMCLAQYSSADMLMYYSAAPHIMNGMFRMDIMSDCLKGYYPFKMFNELYKLGECIEINENGSPIYSCAAKNGNEAAIMLSNYSENDDASAVEVKINVDNFSSAEGVNVEYYLLNETHDMKLSRVEKFTGDAYSIILDVPLYSTYLIKFSKP